MVALLVKVLLCISPLSTWCLGCPLSSALIIFPHFSILRSIKLFAHKASQGRRSPAGIQVPAEKELQLLRSLRQKGDESPSKKIKPTQDSEDWASFLETLASKDLKLMDLDPNLEARGNFLKLNILSDHASHFNPENGSMEELQLSKKRPFESSPPTIKLAEDQIAKAMQSYHQGAFLPSLTQFNSQKLASSSTHPQPWKPITHSSNWTCRTPGFYYIGSLENSQKMSHPRRS